MVIYAPLSLVLSTLYARDHKNSNKVKAHSWESGNEVTRVTSWRESVVTDCQDGKFLKVYLFLRVNIFC